MSKPELKILIGMHRTANAIDRKTAQIAGAYGLTLGQFSVLEALYHKGDLTVGQVQEAILSTSGTIPVIVGKLEKEGMAPLIAPTETPATMSILMPSSVRACQTPHSYAPREPPPLKISAVFLSSILTKDLLLCYTNRSIPY